MEIDFNKEPNPEKRPRKPRWHDVHQSVANLHQELVSFYNAIVKDSPDKSRVEEIVKKLNALAENFNSIAGAMYDFLSNNPGDPGLSAHFRNEEEVGRVQIGFALKYEAAALAAINKFDVLMKNSTQQGAASVNEWNSILKELFELTFHLTKEELHSN